MVIFHILPDIVKQIGGELHTYAFRYQVACLPIPRIPNSCPTPLSHFCPPKKYQMLLSRLRNRTSCCRNQKDDKSALKVLTVTSCERISDTFFPSLTRQDDFREVDDSWSNSSKVKTSLLRSRIHSAFYHMCDEWFLPHHIGTSIFLR